MSNKTKFSYLFLRHLAFTQLILANLSSHFYDASKPTIQAHLESINPNQFDCHLPGTRKHIHLFFFKLFDELLELFKLETFYQLNWGLVVLPISLLE